VRQGGWWVHGAFAIGVVGGLASTPSLLSINLGIGVAFADREFLGILGLLVTKAGSCFL